ncbi:hypothetical protein HK104_009367 [Borealophlyctis nickersoniae]|nr:hypothetical protein HK104_009367 [Borealophlyctis nickersoniae]
MPTTPNKPYIPYYPVDLTQQPYITAQLGIPGVEVRREPFFAVDIVTGAWLATVFVPKFIPPEAVLPSFICMSVLRVDTTWNTVLSQAKPTNTSVVTMFSPNNLTVVATSNTFLVDVSPTLVNGTWMYKTAPLDNTTLALRDSLFRRFGSFQAAATSNVSSYEDVIGGTDTWIINLSLANMSSYADTDSVLLVAALPRSEIYGVIEAARKRSLGVSIGISVAMAVFVSGVYLAVVLPLLKLSKAMGLLTKMDFQSLENSTILDARSVIWELRKVQTTFSTMVKAFAGGIKKNRDMVARTNAGGTTKNSIDGRPSRTTGAYEA